ncbi:MarR family transcriptional regulator [Gordonia sp. Z-3]|jgi:DNA-binding MarR family transcriptional regulator|uniref:MarR family transcriptional regulator n=2 Tax=Gordonia TaxID=2053 RepID=A0A9X3I7F5_9ACTN|nr:MULTISPECIES: MarR family transcriptional regulator [Gordonia]MAU82826.1 transcriptional regulator [Gordonia sp. (in: high G+C Gram-positive bacteria)]MCF3940100.1 MarR family transcriptional regulator [Gordonia tangerina]MCX2967050.1 MarR family transcriptional regulator [Gordonia aquimaris]MED5800412.1 MarR family transcriptional regulator [Gordonia sp. Z-3]
MNTTERGVGGAEAEAPETAPSATELWFTMNSLVRDHAAESRSRIDARIDMPFSRFRALRRVATRELTQSELARRLGIDAPATSVIVNDLVDRGLVSREPRADDRRFKVVAITDAGRAVVDSLVSDPAIAPDMFDALDEAQRRELAGLLGLLRARADA